MLKQAVCQTILVWDWQLAGFIPFWLGPILSAKNKEISYNEWHKPFDEECIWLLLQLERRIVFSSLQSLCWIKILQQRFKVLSTPTFI